MRERRAKRRKWRAPVKRGVEKKALGGLVQLLGQRKRLLPAAK